MPRCETPSEVFLVADVRSGLMSQGNKQGNKQQWYNNKELFEMFSNLKDDFKDLRKELAETRQIVKRYNDLRKEQEEHDDKIKQLEREMYSKHSREEGEAHTWKSIREWTPWTITAFAILYAAMQAGVF